jgi:protein SCO1/2
MGAVVLTVGLWQLSRQSAELEDFGPAPEFALRDQLGAQVTNEDLLGQPWVANFVFTRCASVCPLLTAKFVNLQAEAVDLPAVRYVSFSVDPDHDTPAVLKKYAERFSADPERWSFLTGARDDIERTVVKGVKIHMGEPVAGPEPRLIDIMHGEHFVMVDGEGRLRGYYRSDGEGLARLLTELRLLSHR